jgi:3-hydroxybutyryl-CoA dehydratase
MMSTPEFPDLRVRVGERIIRQMILSREEVATFARLSGDLNPLHYDEVYAQQTRFGGVIVSGPQLVSLMMGLTATHFSQETAMLGLEFTFHFRKAVKVDELITMEWEVVHTEPKASLQGIIASLDGNATNSQGQMVLTGKGKVLVTAKL